MTLKTGIINRLEPLSLGVGLILAQIWVYINVPEWRDNILPLMLITSFVFAFETARTESNLFKVSFVKAFPKTILFAFITLISLYGFGALIGSNSGETLAQGLASVNILLLLVHGLIVAYPEELIFRGWLPENLKKRGLSDIYTAIFSSIVFGLFHWYTAGRQFVVLFPYMILGFGLYQVKNKYSPKTNTANAGVHWGWNAYILAFVEKIF